MKTGMVYLVGAGPGDPELLTVKAHRLIQNAEVVLHDTLTREEVVELAPLTAEVRNVGKKSGENGRITQEEINEMMEQYVRDGSDVIRLKGGDPNVFGRGGEEVQFLASNGIPFEVIPGVSSVLAAPAAAGFPLTHREFGSSFTVITGHEDPEKEESALDWNSIAGMVNAGGTLLILMGVRRLEQNVRALIENDVPGDLPAAVIEKASYPDEFLLTTSLDRLVEQTRSEDVSSPAVFVIGEVVRIRENMDELLLRNSNTVLSAAIESSVEKI